MYTDPFGGEPEPDLTNLDTLIQEVRLMTGPAPVQSSRSPSPMWTLSDGVERAQEVLRTAAVWPDRRSAAAGGVECSSGKCLARPAKYR